MTQEQQAKMVEDCYMRVFSYAFTLAKDRSLAEELTQETFYRAFTKHRDFRGESDEVTWLCAIAKNLFADEMRRQSRMEEMPEASLRIHMALHELEEPYREVFQLRIFGELSFRDIGMIFQKTENWARVTYHRARMKLQERIE